MANVLDDLTTRFKSFSESIDRSLTSIDLSISRQLHTLKGGDRALQQQTDGSDSNNTVQSARTRQEREAAAARAELILEQLPRSYFDQDFDPLAHELQDMGEKAKQEDIDAIVDRLTAAVEVVGVKLAKHVLKNQDKLVAGISNVTSVEDDLRAAHVMAKSSRAQLRMAAEEVQLQIRVITSTRRKQAYMEVLEVASKAKRVKDLHQALRQVHEEGDFAQAILLCVDCFQAVDALDAFKMTPDLRTTVQRLYHDTLQRLDAALHNECSSFTAEGYSKLLEAYVLQSLPGAALATKVLKCFQDAVDDTATRLVRSMVLAKAAFNSEPGSGHADSPRSSTAGAGLDDCSFEDLCKRLTPDAVGSCVCKLLEVAFELMCSYQLMAQWHAAGLQQQDKAMAAAAAAHEPGTASEAQLEQLHATTRDLLHAVAQGLADSRTALMEAVCGRLTVLLTAAGPKCKGGAFTQVLESSLQFVALAESFAGCALPLRSSVLTALAGCLPAFQRSNLEALKLALALENWQPSGRASTDAGSCCDVYAMKRYLESSPYVLPVYGEAAAVTDFSDWMQAGNPFRRSSRAVGAGAAIPASTGHRAVQTQAPSSPVSASANRVATRSSLLVLQCLSSYAALMLLLPSKQLVMWAAVAELFDNFLLACFILFSGVTLEALVWQEEQLPHRLRSALLRITTSPGCKYKAQVEEIQQNKPDTSLLASLSSSFLDFGITPGSSSSSAVVIGSIPSPTTSSSATAPSSSSSSSKLDIFTRKIKDTMVELINTDLSQPLPSNAQSSPQAQPLQAPKRAEPQQQQQQQPAVRSGSPAVAAQQAAVRTASPAAAVLQPPTSSPTPPSSSASSQQQQGPSGRVYGLKERVVAIESLTAIADALKAAKPALLQQLRGAGGAKEAEGYFARTVDAAQDLREAIYRGGATQLLTGVVDGSRGIAAQIAACNYNVKEPASCHQPWTGALLQQFQAFSSFIKGSDLPVDVQDQMWGAAVKLAGDAMLDGFSRVRRCTLQGRAGMSLDLSAVDKGLRSMAPGSAVTSLRLVDNYIKAFYTPWNDLGRWAQIHVAEYGKAKVLVLVEVMAEAYAVRRSDKAALLDRLATELAEFS